MRTWEDRPEPQRITLDDRSTAVVLCPLGSCDWQSDDTRTMTIAGADAVVRWHLLDEHREQLNTLAQLAEQLNTFAQLAGAPAEVCARPHPSQRGRWCTDPRGHVEASHGDGRIDRWLLR